LLHFPRINSAYTDSNPALSKGANHILFQSNRAGGMGDYDIYLYQREKGDDITYEVTEPYWEYGYVVDAINGTPLAGVTVNIVDSDGNVVVQTVTDEEGDFHVKIPAGVKLPLGTQTADGKGKVVVIDEVGDDTYVPDFQLGELKFTKVWVEDKAESGYETKIWFDVETDASQHNVAIDVLLMPLHGNASDMDMTKLENLMSEDIFYHFTSLMIDDLGHRGEEAVVKTQATDGRVTTLTYEPGSDNKKVHVEHTFVVPEIEEGT
jgi:hypothetical protein